MDALGLLWSRSNTSRKNGGQLLPSKAEKHANTTHQEKNKHDSNTDEEVQLNTDIPLLASQSTPRRVLSSSLCWDANALEAGTWNALVDDRLASAVSRAAVGVFGASLFSLETAGKVAEWVWGLGFLGGSERWGGRDGGGRLDFGDRLGEWDFGDKVLALRYWKGRHWLLNQCNAGGGGFGQGLEHPTHGGEGGGEFLRVNTINLGDFLLPVSIPSESSHTEASDTYAERVDSNVHDAAVRDSIVLDPSVE